MVFQSRPYYCIGKHINPVKMDDQKNILTNFLKNRYTRHDYFSVYRGFAEGEKNKTFLEAMEKHWEEVDVQEAEGFNQELSWNMISGKLDLQAVTLKNTPPQNLAFFAKGSGYPVSALADRFTVLLLYAQSSNRRNRLGRD